METFDAYIEMLAGSALKHVYDEKQGKLVVHRKSALPLPEHFNYGFIKGTSSEDGDPLDVFVISTKQLKLGSTIQVRPIGILYVEDEMGIDNKIIAADASDGSIASLNEFHEIGEEEIRKLSYMLEHNKDGLEGRWTKVKGHGSSAEAIAEIHKSIEKANQQAKG
ncbi:MAG: inorganic diphosphatase [Candidatus Micrarchaeia archaeon]